MALTPVVLDISKLFSRFDDLRDVSLSPQDPLPESHIRNYPKWQPNGHSANLPGEALGHALPAMLWTADGGGRARFFNQRWRDFTGLTVVQSMDGRWVDAVHAEDVRARLEAQDSAIATRTSFELEYRLRRADGEFRWVLDQGAPELDAQGAFRGYVGVIIDITDRKRAEDQLRWLSKAVEQSPVTVVITDLKGRIEYVNPKFTEVTGYSREEAIGQNPRILKSGETSAEEYRKLWEELKTGEWQGEFHNKRKNGELYWEAAALSAIRDETGIATHYIAIKEDITRRKAAEAALNETEERLRFAIENARLFVYDIDAATGHGVIYGHDDFFSHMRTVEQWIRAVHPEDRARVIAAHRRRQHGLSLEYRIVDSKGTVRHYSDSGAPTRNGRWIGVLRDITEEKNADATIAQLAAVVECSNNAIISFDTRGIIRSWNRAAERLYGYCAEEIVGRHATALSPVERRELATRNIQRILDGRAAPAYETEHMRKDGTVFPVSLAASPMRDRHGDIVGGSGIIQDVTSKKSSEKALKESENRFRALVQHSTDVITLIDPQGLILYDSPGLFDLLGIRPEQRQGRPAFEWIHPDDLSYMGMLHQELVSGSGARMRAQIRLRHADGSWRWCDSWAINLLSEPGVGAIVSSFRDITDLKAIEAALRESEQRYRKLIEDASDVIFSIDVDGNFTSVNLMGERLSGYSRQELLGMQLWQAVPPEQVSVIRAAIGERVKGTDELPLETELLTRDGRRVSMEISGRLQFKNGAPVGMLCIGRDISQRKRAEHLEKNQREVLEMVAQNQPLESVLGRLEEMIEYDYPGTAAQIRMLGTGPVGPSEAIILRVPILASNGLVLGNIEIQHAGAWKVDDFEHIVLDSKAKLAAIALEHRQLTDRLSHQAQHDPLTGLPNRSLLDDRLRQAIVLARRQGRMVAVIYVDLDRFKFINDTLGHDVGDVLLKEVAKRLEGAVRVSDTLARPGGDEFVAVLFGIDSADDAEEVGERMIESMSAPFQVIDHELFISASVGISLFPQDGEDAATLQKHADVAMYEAKSRGRNRFQQFAYKMNAASQERLEVENHLHRALERNELQLYYQPQFQLPGIEPGGVEALLRWNHPRWGLLAPGRFVPIAEESGLIIPIGLWVLREACRQHQVWRKAGHPPVRMAVNISASQFARSSLARKVAEALEAHQVEPRYLELELTEGVLMRDTEDSTRQIAELRALGVRLSIDDFGTGYSSLGYLQRLPIDDLKIDKCFVQGIDQAANTQPLIRAIVGLAHGLHMTATAEGVETEGELETLKTLGCDRVQGFLLGRPAPAATLEALWQAGGQRTIWCPGLPSDLPVSDRI